MASRSSEQRRSTVAPAVPPAVLATFVAGRWTARLRGHGLEDAATWGLVLGSGSFPEAADVVARRMLQRSTDPRLIRALVVELHAVLDEVVGETDSAGEWWRWLGELQETLSWGGHGGRDLRLAMAFEDGALREHDHTRSPALKVAEALVATARRALVCDDCEFHLGPAQPVDQRGAETPFTTSCVVRGGGVSGKIVVSRASRPFDRRERACLEGLAAEAGFALEAFGVADRARVQTEQLWLLYRVSCQLQVDLDLESVLGAVCEAVCTIVGAERAVILELLPDGSLARVGSYRMNVTVEPELGRRGLATDLAKRALADAGPLMVSIEELVAEVGHDVLERLGVKRALGCVPLRAAGEAVGLVFFDHSGRQFSLDQTQRENCATVANLAALAIERVRLQHAANRSIRLQERERIAQDLHDSVAQQLFRVGIELRRAAVADPSTAAALETARSLLADASARLRQAIREPTPDERPPCLDETVRATASAFAVRTGTCCTCRVDLPAEPPGPLASLAARFVGEALTNVEKHAGAARATVDVRHEDMWLVATVADDGVGPGNDRGDGAGLSMLRREAATWGGEVAIEGAQQGGAVVSLSLPWVVRGG